MHSPKEIEQVESEVVVEIPLDLLPVVLDEVYEAAEPPGTSLIPLP